ncbi:MAG: VWA domain-containing protein [Pyrinomonadaceae bacterium]
MNHFLSVRRIASLTLATFVLLGTVVPLSVLGQSGRQQPATGDKKKNKRPDTPPGDQQDPPPVDVVNRPQDSEVVTIASNLVDVDAVVYNKKTKAIVTGLKKENFRVYEDGQEMEITNFSTPDAPITVAVVVEYSKLGEMIGYYGSGGMDDGKLETVRPVAQFLTQFVRPTDYVSVIAFDIRPTPLTDFTNDPARLNAVISLLLRNNPAFKETNLFDALKFTLMGGKGDSVVLEHSEKETSEYAGLASVTGRRTAVLLVASGLDTFSKINLGEVRKVIQNAGVPIYIIGTGNMFLKKYDAQMSAQDGVEGATAPGRMSFLQAASNLTTFSKESGGAFYPVTFPGEIGADLQAINILLRNQYSLGYRPIEKPGDKQRKIVVKVDVDGDGVTDDKEFVIQHRQFYNPKKATPPATTK